MKKEFKVIASLLPNNIRVLDVGCGDGSLMDLLIKEKNIKVRGVVVNPDIFFKEIQEYGVSGRAFMDKHCGIIEQSHLDQDSKGRLKEKIGSTGSGTGPANAERAMRTLKMAKDVESL